MDCRANQLAWPLMRVAVVGAGWAGLAAAVHARLRGYEVSVFEMSGQLGGRARTVPLPNGMSADNGQHILIGAYTETQRLMRLLGVDPEQALQRRSLCLVDAQGKGLQLGKGDPQWAFVRAVCQHRNWTWRERGALTAQVLRWAMWGYRCVPDISVAKLSANIPERLRNEFINPLCIAALNTLPHEASGAVFLRVLRDALKSGPGSADLLLPRRPLGELLPQPARLWFAEQGVGLHTHQRVQALQHQGSQWRLITASMQRDFDHVVLACTSHEAARLVQPIRPNWAKVASALCYEPITTVTLYSQGIRLAQPMLTLNSDQTERPAQFVFDQGQLAGRPGELSFVISAAQTWIHRGTQVLNQATLAQAQWALRGGLSSPLQHVRTLTEKRATFRCTPGLVRPAPAIAPGLWAAADYVQGPYPATLEGAVRCAVRVVQGM
jgi:hydroxysqualene dehydroxylase